MQAIRLHPSPDPSTPYSPTNPAPPSALTLDTDIPIPQPSNPNEVLVRIKATTVIRDALTWPETYAHEYTIPGHDLAGTVAAVFPASPNPPFKPGDEVFGMAHADRGSAWAEYALVRDSEIAHKPKKLSWEEAAAMPLSAQTAYEALLHAGIPLSGGAGATPERKKTTILITGAAGGVGVYLVQLARRAGLRVVAASSSNARNGEFLRDLGADETVEYAALHVLEQDRVFDIIVDTVGGDVLEGCWDLVKTPTGSLISVDSASFDFVREHERKGIRKEGVKALFFIVQGSGEALAQLARFADEGSLKVFVLDRYPLGKAVEAYERASGRGGGSGRGKIVLTV